MLPLAASEVVLAVIVALVVVIVVLAILGYVATRRRDARNAAVFRRQVEEANERLADAHAEDNGWAEDRIFAAARVAAGAEAGREVHLVQVIDRAGSDEDEAVCAVFDASGERQQVRLGRRGDEWVAI